MNGCSNDFLKMLVYALQKQDKCYCDSIYIKFSKSTNINTFNFLNEIYNCESDFQKFQGFLKN